MKKLSTNQDGFSAVEAVLILVIVGIISFVGYFVYHSTQKSTDALNSATETSNNIGPKFESKKASPGSAKSTANPSGSSSSNGSSSSSSQSGSSSSSSGVSTTNKQAAASSVNNASSSSTKSDQDSSDASSALSSN